MTVTNEQIKIENEQLQEMFDDFVSENNKYKKISKMIWDTLFFHAGDSFITMNKKERDQFFRTYIVYDDLADGTRKQYKRAFDNIADFVEGEPRKVKDNCECNNKTNLVHNPRNKDNKTNDSDSDKLCESISSLRKSLNLTEQEIKDLEQKLEKLRNKFACDKCRLAKIERVQKEYRRVQKESKRVQEEVKEVLSY